MARRKKIYRDKEYERDLKREKIKEYVTYVWLAILFSGICIIGYNQYNDSFVGWGVIALGLWCIGYAVFYLITISHKWKILTDYDTEEHKGRELLDESIYSQELKKHIS